MTQEQKENIKIENDAVEIDPLERSEYYDDNVDSNKDELETKKGKNIIKRSIDRMDQYFYDIEVLFSTNSENKIPRRARNTRVFKAISFFTISFLLSFVGTSGYYFITNSIQEEHGKIVNRIDNNGGVSIIFQEGKMKLKN